MIDKVHIIQYGFELFVTIDYFNLTEFQALCSFWHALYKHCLNILLPPPKKRRGSFLLVNEIPSKIIAGLVSSFTFGTF